MSRLSSHKARIAHIFSDRGPKLLKDLLSLVSGQLLSMVIGFFTFAYLARTMEPESYGAIEYAIAIAAFAAIVIECGAGPIGVRALSRSPDKAPAIAAQVPAARFAMAIIVIPIVGLSANLTSYPPPVVALIWLFALSLLAVPLNQDWLLQGLEKMGLKAFAQPIRSLIFAAGIFIFVKSTQDLLKVGLVEIASVVAVSAYFLIVQRIWAVRFSFRWPLRDVYFYLKEGFAVGLSNILWAFMLYSPMFLLVSLVGGQEPAWLGAAQRIVISLLTLSFLYHFNIYPVITRTIRHDKETWARFMQSSIRLVAWGGIGLALTITLLGPVIMPFVFGPAFEAGTPVLAALIWIFPLRMLSGHTRWSLVACGQQKYLLLAEIIGASTLWAVGFAIIPAMQATGAALALASGVLTSGIVTQYFAEKNIGKISLPGKIAIPLAAAITAITVANFLSENTAVQTVIGVGIFLAAALFQFRNIFADLKKIAYAKADQS